jgi:pimeloyl-ACP methyl ester carboxylesterase
MVTTEVSLEQNKHLLFLLPGQSLSPRAFWDFKLPDGYTHIDYFLGAGIDVILFDPCGYGESSDYYQYDRVGYADQIESAIRELKKEYVSKTIFGFSTSTAPALIAGERGLFDKVIIHSPSIRMDKRYYVDFDTEYFETGIEKLKKERLEKISDKLIPTPNRIEDWEQKILDVVGSTTWKVPSQPVYDINNYWVDTGQLGFDPAKVPPTLSIIGEYDYESTTGGYETFRRLFPDSTEVIIPNSTHFSMWENESCRTRAEIVKYCLTFIQ